MRTLLFLAPVAGVLALGAYACSDDTSAATTDFTTVLASVTTGVIEPENSDLTTQADALVTATTELETSPSPETLATAQAAWRATRRAWRKLDTISFGPIADLGLTDRIDVAPASGADIEAIVAGTKTIDLASVGAQGGKTKGFLGLEYLLFAKPLADLSGDGAPARRRALAHWQAAEIAQTAHQLADAWTGSASYASQVTNAGKGSTRYLSQRAAIDDLVGGVAYALELVVGVRLAYPLGRKNDGTPKPDLDPTGASDNLVADVKASLDGVSAVYTGQGLQSRAAATSAALDQKFTTDLAACAAKVAAIPAPFATAVTTQTAVVQAAYDACKTAKATWNTDVTSALGATLRPTDNDGD